MPRNVFVRALAGIALAAAIGASAAGAATTARDRAVPHYDHLIVVLEENKTYATIVNGKNAPHLHALATAYGLATHMYAESHPSEPNYVALVSGTTGGIRDDAGWFTTGHLIPPPDLATQLRAKGLAWRAYLEDLPAPGSFAILSGGSAHRPAGLYAAKHTGFTNLASVHRDGGIASELVGFDRLDADLARGSVPAFALVVPNQCNEMHGVRSPAAPPDCRHDDDALIRRGDAAIGRLVARIQASPFWAHGNNAIVITFDEDEGEGRIAGELQRCCVFDAQDPGGGHIPTIVIANHGPRGLRDATPYDHYSLLRTIEDALGLDGHVRHADDPGVQPMTPLFANGRP
jgi:hypothetical protein